MDQPLPLGDVGETWSISQLYDELTSYLDRRWGRAHQVWVMSAPPAQVAA